MPPAPDAPPTLATLPGVESGTGSAAATLFREVATAHRAYFSLQAEAQTRFLQLRRFGPPGVAPGAADAVAVGATPELIAPLAVSPAPAEAPPLLLNRAQLEGLAVGRIADGPGVASLCREDYASRLRLPAPPMLLIDRVLALEGEAGSMGAGRIVTETDVVAGAWYLQDGRMTMGAILEAGQGDLLLISWLGAAGSSQGSRIWRRLGCDVVFHGPPPVPGETLRYDIRAAGGENGLFSYSCECWAQRGGDERKLLSVRDGRAGFLTEAEIPASGGEPWEGFAAGPISDTPCVPPPRASAKRAFERADLDLLAAGDAFGCFGAGFERAAPHQRTPSFPIGRLRLIDSAPVFDPCGGPWGRGYLRAEAGALAGASFYEGRTHNDPRMPAALTAEGAAQALAFAMAALGFTIERDSWRFEPMRETPHTFVFPGEVLPDQPHQLTYEIFIEEILDEPEPKVLAAAICRCDGVEILRCRRMGLTLTPDWPLAQRPEAAPRCAPRTVGPSGEARGDEYAMMACAWGRPSEAFGRLGAPYDGPRRSLRLPGPPYHLVSRIRAVDCALGVATIGGTVVSEYDVPRDGWYFDDGRGGIMPFPVLMEIALQPCGWLSCYMGLAAQIDGDALFRNLDGDNVRCLKPVTRESGVLTVTARLDRLARAGGSTIVFFKIEVRDTTRPVMTLDAAFGFFLQETLNRQMGLPSTPKQREAFLSPAPHPPIPFESLAAEAGSPLPHGRIRMIDRITGYWPQGGKAGLGRIRGEQSVDPRAWYFKAHFFQDPVQPGSLGIEALIQLLQAFVRLSNLASATPNPMFGPAAADRPLIWRFRGQVTPESSQVVTLLDITEITPQSDGGLLIAADGGLWVDGLPIYRLDGLALRIAPAKSRIDD